MAGALGTAGRVPIWGVAATRPATPPGVRARVQPARAAPTPPRRCPSWPGRRPPQLLWAPAGVRMRPTKGTSLTESDRTQTRPRKRHPRGVEDEVAGKPLRTILRVETSEDSIGKAHIGRRTSSRSDAGSRSADVRSRRNDRYAVHSSNRLVLFLRTVSSDKSGGDVDSPCVRPVGATTCSLLAT